MEGMIRDFSNFRLVPGVYSTLIGSSEEKLDDIIRSFAFESVGECSRIYCT